MPHKEPVEEDVQWCGNQQHIGGRLEETLSLHKTLASFEDDKSRDTEKIDLEVHAGQFCGAVFWDHHGQNFRGVHPEDNEREEEDHQKADHPLDLQPYEVLVP